MQTLYEVMDSGIDDSSLFCVLAALAHHKNNKTGNCFPSIPAIIRTSRLSENTVIKSLKRLKALGYISWTQEPGKKRFYQIHLDSLPKCAPPVKTTPLKSEPSQNLGGHPPQNWGDTLPKSGGLPSPNLPPEPGSNQEINQEGNQESSLSRLGEFPNADDPETLPYDEAPLFDDYPELDEQALQIKDSPKNDISESDISNIDVSKSGTTLYQNLNHDISNSDISIYQNLILKEEYKEEVNKEVNKEEISAPVGAPKSSLESEPKKEKKQRKKAKPLVQKPDGVDQRLWDDWMVVRKAKRAPMTETAWEDMVLEAKKAGLELNEAIKICVVRNWRGFNASWNWQGTYGSLTKAQRNPSTKGFAGDVKTDPSKPEQWGNHEKENKQFLAVVKKATEDSEELPF